MIFIFRRVCRQHKQVDFQYFHHTLLKHTTGRCVRKSPSPLHVPYVYEDTSYTYFILAWDLTRHCQTKLTEFVTQAMTFLSYLSSTTPADTASSTDYPWCTRCCYCNYPKVDREYTNPGTCASAWTHQYTVSSGKKGSPATSGLLSPVLRTCGCTSIPMNLHFDPVPIFTGEAMTKCNAMENIRLMILLS